MCPLRGTHDGIEREKCDVHPRTRRQTDGTIRVGDPAHRPGHRHDRPWLEQTEWGCRQRCRLLRRNARDTPTGAHGRVVTIVELVGGILLVVGFLTQIVGILIALDMLGAILFAYLLRGAPFIENGAITWEKEAVFAAAALCIVLAGSGAWSIDDVVAENRTRVVVT